MKHATTLIKQARHTRRRETEIIIMAAWRSPVCQKQRTTKTRLRDCEGNELAIANQSDVMIQADTAEAHTIMQLQI